MSRILALAAMIVMVLTAQPAVARVASSQASATTPYCVVLAQNGRTSGGAHNPLSCFSSYRAYAWTIDRYPNYVATFYSGTNYTGWRLALVSYRGCAAGGHSYPKYVSDLYGTGFRDNINSSKVYGTNCVHGSAYRSPRYCNVRYLEYGMSNHHGYLPFWGYGRVDSLTINKQITLSLC